MIRRIRIRNFKSLRDVTVDLSPVTVLIGRSGTGKTNFVDAIRFLRDYVRNGRIDGRWGGEWAHIPCATKPLDTTTFEIDFDVPDIEESFSYRLSLSQQHPLPSTESLRKGDRVLFSQELQTQSGMQPRWTTEPKVSPAVPPGQSALSRLPALEDVVLAHTLLATGIGVHHFVPSVLAKPGESNGSSDQQDGLWEGAGNYLRVLREITTDLRDRTRRAHIKAAVRMVNDTIETVELDNVMQPQAAVVAHVDGERRVPIALSRESDGLRRFYAHLLALYQTPSKQLLVFEEPENGIYPGALAVLAEEFQAAPHDHGTQVLLTTHSPQLLDKFNDEQIRVVVLEGLETKIGPLAPEQREAIREQLLFPGELFTVDPARMEVSR
jgi:ABC-type branched-subunit amino acid transport system ATPase component